jgi:hypothetical protein
MRKRYLYFAAVVAAALAWRGWEARPPADAVAPLSLRAQPVSEPARPADLDFERRALGPASSDLFVVPPKPVVRAAAATAQIIEPPKAPPLPYKYDGSGVVQGKSFVFLARDGRNLMASAGDTLDGTYFVEALARDRVVLRYLPLGIRQVLLYAGGEAPPETVAAPERGVQPVALRVDMPAEVLLGEEFVVTLALPGAGLKATVEVGYDHEVLRMVGPGVRSAGRALVELASGNAPRAELRFKVLAETPTPTDIELQANATDGSGRRIPVSAPPAHTVSVVLPGGG